MVQLVAQVVVVALVEAQAVLLVALLEAQVVMVVPQVATLEAQQEVQLV